MKKIILTITALTLMLFGCSSGSNNKNVVNVYTTRDYQVDVDIYEQFEKETGIKVNCVELENAELLAKLQEEKGKVADVVFMVGAESLYKVQELGILKDINIDETNFSENFYGKNWSGISGRIRNVAVSKESNLTITSYDDLAREEFFGKVLVRSSSNSYNQSLVSSMIMQKGEAAVKTWLEGFVKNFARTPEGNDRDQVKAINSGLGEVALVNNYYMQKLLTSTDSNEVKAGESVNIPSLNEEFLNISWMGKISDNANAEKLIQYFKTESVQSKISLENGENPLNSDASTNQYITDLKEVNILEVNYEELGKYIDEAYQMMLEAGWE